MTERQTHRGTLALWLLVGFFSAALFAVGWWALHTVGNRPHRQGDGRNPESYGFSLQNFSLDRFPLVASGLPRDGIPALSDPGSLAPDALAALGRRFLLPGDPVAGVVVQGEARAYPLRVLVFHELVNDTLGGEPVLVVHQPLCGLTAVFSRRLEGRPATFGHSGLVWNSCGLAYDRETQSLWLPLAGTAVAGPAVGKKLQFLPFTLTTWARWRERHPETTVVAPDASRLAWYRRDPYASYLGSDILRFPVRPTLPPPFRPKASLVVLDPAGTRSVLLLETAKAEPTRFPLASFPESWLELVPVGHPPVWEIATSPPTSPLPVLYTFAFAWYALHPDPGPAAWQRFPLAAPIP